MIGMNLINRKHFLKLTNKWTFSILRNYSKNYYQILGVSMDASQKEIKNAFIKLSKMHHPDKSLKKKGHLEFVKINEAYSVLGKASTRNVYNDLLQDSINLKNHSYQYQNVQHQHYEEVDCETSYWDPQKQAFSSQAPEADNYYGIKGIKRQSNNKIAALSLSIVVLGFVIFYLAFRFYSRKIENQFLLLDEPNYLFLEKALAKNEKNKINLLTDKNK